MATIKFVKNRVFQVLTIVTFLSISFPVFATDDDGEAPEMDPSDDIAVLIDNSEHISVSASGGTTKDPSDPPCTIYTCGPTKYVWDYGDGLEGDPESGAVDSLGALSIKRDKEGKITLKVKASQTWALDGDDSIEFSPWSKSIAVKVQKPTSLAYVSCEAIADGGSFKFTVKDQDSEPIKNADVGVIESGTDDFTVANHPEASGSTPLGNGRCNQDGSDEEGNIVDQPVGASAESLKDTCNQAMEDITMEHEISHSYDYFKVPDGTQYQTGFTPQNQHIVQKATYNPTNTNATSVETTTCEVDQ
jgi:hypothetical protein